MYCSQGVAKSGPQLVTELTDLSIVRAADVKTSSSASSASNQSCDLEQFTLVASFLN